ncbi:transposase domain-containing protein [Cryptosporangium sp. NPDC051539]|uniref:transposase domain-containing protein n=1 Tax=Cryptosporangium sp. NPDC051539 TaxID=3363962 RepID=UPI00379553DA
MDEVVAAEGRTQKRSRLLPARLVMYFVLAMCLFSGQGYEEVARLLTDGLRRRRWSGGWQVPSTAAIWKGRRRLGVEPVKALFAQVCRPVAGPGTARRVLPWLASGRDRWQHVRSARHSGERGGIRPAAPFGPWPAAGRYPLEAVLKPMPCALLDG